MARFVLIHGAYHGAWCWEGFAQQLRDAGHKVEAIDLPGCGEDPSPMEQATMDDYRDRIVEQLRSDPEPAVLVGHSFGGIAITAAAGAAPEKVAQLVYVAAYLPGDGESLISLAAKAADDVDPDMTTVEGDPPITSVKPETAKRIFYGNCSPEDADRAANRLNPLPMSVFFGEAKFDDSVLPPRRYVFTLRDKALPLSLQRRMVADRPCVETAELESDHSPFLSHPDELLSILNRFADAPTHA